MSFFCLKFSPVNPFVLASFAFGALKVFGDDILLLAKKNLLRVGFKKFKSLLKHDLK